MRVCAFFFFCVFSFFSCGEGEKCDALNSETCHILKEFAVFDSIQPLSFHHICSGLDNNNFHYWTAYAFFELDPPSDITKALVLAKVYVGWIGWAKKSEDAPSFKRDPKKAEDRERGVGLEIKKIAFKNPDWNGEPLFLRFQMRSLETETEAESPALSINHEHNWTKLAEEQIHKKAAEPDLYERPPIGMEETTDLFIEREDIERPKNSHRLYLLLKQGQSKEILSLKGPVLSHLPELLGDEISGARILGFWDVINPFFVQEGGLWDMIGDALKYGDCDVWPERMAHKEFRLHQLGIDK